MAQPIADKPSEVEKPQKVADPKEVSDCEEVLKQYVTGHAQDANVFPQLLAHLRANPDEVLSSFTKMTAVMVENAESGVIALRAGQHLVTAAITVDKQAGGSGIAEAVLQQSLVLAGKPGRSSVSRAQRTQSCAMLAALAAEVPTEQQKAVEAKLLDFADDRVPSIREKAMRGLAALAGNEEAHEESQRTLGNRTRDMCTAVRAVAVRSLKLSTRTAALLLARFQDCEGCVRAELFNKLAEQPEAVEDFGPASLLNLITGLKDHSPHVRAAAGVAIQAWCKHLGGVATLFCRCDVVSDEAKAEVAVGPLVTLCGQQALTEALQLLEKGFTSSVPGAPEKALLTRWAISSMTEEEREDKVNEPALLEQTREVLNELSRKGGCDFVLRQLLAMVAGMDSTDYQRSREVQILAKDVLFQAPLPKLGLGVSRRTAFLHVHHTSIDWGMILIRKNTGCYSRQEIGRHKKQQLEMGISQSIVTLVAEYTKQAIPDDEEDAADASICSRLSRELEEVKDAYEEQKAKYDEIEKRKKKAIQEEDFIGAHKLKDEAKRLGKDLGLLNEKCSILETERDGICLRILAITTALLRWTNSNLKRDPALGSILESILKPMMALKALSPEVEVEVLRAIATFCSIDSDAARSHWNFLFVVFNGICDEAVAASQNQEDEAASADRQLSRCRAAITATALADCARIHGGLGHFDREMVLTAAQVLARVPFTIRDVAMMPLICWFHTFGHIFFEEHLRIPITELHWTLGWMLVDCFRQRIELDGDGKNTVEDCEDDTGDSEKNMGFCMDLHRFFNFLPKIDGKHAAPMLCLAVEAVAEYGLWRAAVLTPKEVPGRIVWTRHFSWPGLFKFAHERLSAELRYRLWRCALQLCVTYPELAPVAEVHNALFAVASKGDAPPGAGVLISCAIALGADDTTLSPVASVLGETKEATVEEALQVLKAREFAEREEKESLGALMEFGVDVTSWGVCDIKVPKMTPPGFVMRAPVRKNKKDVGAPAAPASDSASPTPADAAANPAAEPESSEPVLPCTEDAEDSPPGAARRPKATGRGKANGRGKGAGRGKAGKTKAATDVSPRETAKRRKVSSFAGGA